MTAPPARRLRLHFTGRPIADHCQFVSHGAISSSEASTATINYSGTIDLAQEIRKVCASASTPTMMPQVGMIGLAWPGLADPPNWQAGTAVCPVMPTWSASGAKTDMVSAAWPPPA